MNLKNIIRTITTSTNQKDVARYEHYLKALMKNTKRNWFLEKTSDEELVAYFRKVEGHRLSSLWGDNITLNNNGISFDYIAYRLKMLIAYPETVINKGVVYEGDTFSYSTKDGKVTYEHIIKDPFNKNTDKVLGAWVVIKNSRGEFITVLNKEQLDDLRQKAKTDVVWKEFPEAMVEKSVIKKACKGFFGDLFSDMDKEDSSQYELENPLGLPLKVKQEMDELKTIDGLRKYYMDNKDSFEFNVQAHFNKYVNIRKEQIKLSASDKPEEKTNEEE